MNELIKNISDISVSNTEKVHQLLDEVLVVTTNSFTGTEITLNQQTVIFEFNLDKLRVTISRDLNRFTVDIKVFDGANVIAGCGIDIFGGFDERYSKFTNKDTKLRIATYFSDVSDIDVSSLGKSTDVEEIPTVDESDVEVVSE